MKDEEEIRYDRFLEDGDGLVVIYPNEKDDEKIPQINKSELEMSVSNSSLNKKKE